MKLGSFKYDYEYDWILKKQSKKEQENLESKPTIVIEESKSIVKAPSKPMMVKQ